MPAWIRKTSLSAFCLAALILAVHAQDETPNALPQPPEIPKHLGGRPEQDRLWRPQPTPAETPKKADRPASQPVITPPDDDIYVGVVDRQFFRKTEMDNRVNRMLVMSDAVGWKDREARESLRINLEQMVLTEWAELTILAVHAQQEGHRVTESEIQEKLNEIYEQERKTPEVARTMQAIGITREELVGYVRDGILAEKLISSYMKKNLEEKDYQSVYQMLPDMFVVPERVELNYMSMQLSGEETLAERRRLMKDMEEWRKKASKKGKFVEVAKDFAEPELGQMGGYYGWATSRSLPRDESAKTDKSKGSISIKSTDKIVKAVFGLKNGEISPVLIGDKGLYIFQMIDRQKASGTEYKTAKPMVESAIYERVKAGLMAQIVPQHTIYMAPGGIDFKAIAEAKKSGEDLKAYREEQRKKKFFEHYGDRILQSEAAGQVVVEKSTGGFSPEISARSLEILKQTPAKGSDQPTTMP